LAYPVRNGAWIGLILCAIVAVMAWIAGHVPMYGRLAATILTFSIYAYHLFIIRETAKGKRALPHFGHVQDYRSDMFWPGAKAALVAFLLYVPLIYWSIWHLAPAAAEVASARVALSFEEDAAARAKERAEHPASTRE